MIFSLWWPWLFDESDAYLHIAEACRSGAVPCAHYLLGLALTAVRRAPKRPMIARADCIATIPELGGDAAVARILDHAAFLAALDLRSEEHTSELQSLRHLVCRLLLEKI